MMHKQYSILIVDDEPGLLFSLAAYLEDEGYLVKGASSGEEALSLLDQETYNAVIVDVRLPGIDGNEVILRAKKNGSKAIFLIHTGSTEYQIPSALKQMGITHNDILLKPQHDMDIFCQVLKQKLKFGDEFEKNKII